MSMDEIRNSIRYVQKGDYLVPDLEEPKNPDKPLGKYGLMRLRYLEEHKPITYNHLLLSEELTPHLYEVDEAANNRLEQLMPELAKAAGATEQLKAEDMMKWVGLMNNCKAQAEEIIFEELIYN